MMVADLFISVCLLSWRLLQKFPIANCNWTSEMELRSFKRCALELAFKVKYSSLGTKSSTNLGTLGTE